MEIIEAGIEHLWEIQDLSNELLLDDYNNYDKSILTNRSHSEKWEKFFRNWITDNENIIYLAMDQWTPIWYIYWWIYCNASWRTWPEYIAELFNFYIQEKYRWAWLGVKLYEKFEEWSKVKEVEKISVNASATNQKVIKLYKKIWFEEYITKLEKKIT